MFDRPGNGNVMSVQVVWLDPAEGGNPLEYRSNEFTKIYDVVGVFWIADCGAAI